MRKITSGEDRTVWRLNHSATDAVHINSKPRQSSKKCEKAWLFGKGAPIQPGIGPVGFSCSLRWPCGIEPWACRLRARLLTHCAIPWLDVCGGWHPLAVRAQLGLKIKRSVFSLIRHHVSRQKQKVPRSRSRTSDLEISIASIYSLPLYLSYTRTSHLLEAEKKLW